MRFIPLQKLYDIILCCQSNRRVQTVMNSWLWRRVIYGINLRVLVAMVTELCTHFILQWYETHTMLCNGMKCIPVLILKSRHTFSQTIIFSQINKFFVHTDWSRHLLSLIRVFVVRSVGSQGAKTSSGSQRRLWSDCAYAQAEQSLHWTHKSLLVLSYCGSCYDLKRTCFKTYMF